MIPLIELHRQGQHHGGDGYGNHNAGEHQSGGQGIAVAFNIGNAVHNDGGCAALNIAHGGQQQAGGSVHDVQTQDFLEQVPRWYWGDEYYSADPNSDKNKKDIFIKNSKSYLELCNGCKVYAKAAGPNSARGVSSVSILILDEAAFMEEGPAAYASAVAATSAVANAKIIMVSTPNGKDELYYKTYKQAVEKKNGFTVVEFKWYQDLRYNRFLRWHRKNEKTGEEEWIVEKTIDDMGRIEYAPERWASLEKEGWKASSHWYIKMCE